MCLWHHRNISNNKRKLSLHKQLCIWVEYDPLILIFDLRKNIATWSHVTSLHCAFFFKSCWLWEPLLSRCQWCIRQLARGVMHDRSGSSITQSVRWNNSAGVEWLHPHVLILLSDWCRGARLGMSSIYLNSIPQMTLLLWCQWARYLDGSYRRNLIPTAH